jgi:hypothetical protein
MAKIINPRWADDIREKVACGKVVNETLSATVAAQWLITFLSTKNIPFKVFYLGAGVKRITTETDTCPCCKRKL